MIDLSFLTEEEQETILAVLKRDAELKIVEKQRVQNLQRTVSDKSQLRYMTGEWFYETKQLRHQDRIHGSEIIRASMRHSHKPLTILELSRILPEKPSFVGSENKEVFIPPVLSGVLQEPHIKLSSETYQNQRPYQTPQDTPAVLQSPTKQRKNPFNSDVIANHTFEDQIQTPKADVSEQCHSEFQSPAVSGLVSVGQESGKPVHLDTEPKEDHHYQAKATDWPNRLNICHQKLLEQRTDFSVDTLNVSAAYVTIKKPVSVKQEVKATEITEARTLQLPALQNTLFKETVDSVDPDSQQEATEGRVVQLPEKLSNLRAFWERENSGPKIIFTREEVKCKDITRRRIESSLGYQTNCDVESNSNSFSSEMEMDTAGRSQENILSPQTECGLLVDLSEKDGTYRARPVLIYEETDDSLTGSGTGSQISVSQENKTPAPSSIAFNTQKQNRNLLVPLPRQSSSSLQKDHPAKIYEVKHFLEKKCIGPRVIAESVMEASCSLKSYNKVVSPQSDHTHNLDNGEKSKGGAHAFPHNTRCNVLESLKVTGKGFVSQRPDRPQLGSSSSTWDVESKCHQSCVKAKSEYQERPLSSGKSQTPGSKDKDDVRKSPSKTCHPRILPQETSSPKRSKLEGSPLKTFQIVITPQTKVVEEQQGKWTPVPRQKKSPSHEAKQTDSKPPSTDITSHPLPLHLDDSNVNTQESSSNSSSSPQCENASEKKMGTISHLARSFIPQDYQHYLGPQEKAHVPLFYQERSVAAENDVVHTPENALTDFVGNPSDIPTEKNPPEISSWIVQNKDGIFSQDTVIRVWSLASSGNSLPLSASTLSSSKQMKTSVSMTALQDETDSDSTFDTSLGGRRNTGSSTSNLSLSSGMASISSVSGSISNIYPAEFGDTEVQGSIQFAVNYIKKLSELHIFVVHCRDLAVADTKKNCSEPISISYSTCDLETEQITFSDKLMRYIKCYLLPDKTKLGKRKTTVKKRTLNPNYNEILQFKIVMEVLKTQSLSISVWHNNSFGRNSFLGEVELDLSEWDFSNTNINEYMLNARVSSQSPAPSTTQLVDSRAQMRVALRFLPRTSQSKRPSMTETGEVQIWVKDCKNLPSVRGVIIDPFVKCTVLPDTSQRSRQKTRVVKRTANPMFNHTMVYDGFRPEDLREACVEISVWDHDRMNNHYIGGLRLGLGTGKSYGVDVVWMDSTSNEANLWQRMLQCNCEWVEDVLPLRMLKMAKSMLSPGPLFQNNGSLCATLYCQKRPT